MGITTPWELEQYKVFKTSVLCGFKITNIFGHYGSEWDPQYRHSSMSKLVRPLKVQPIFDAKNKVDVPDVAQNQTHLLLPIESWSKLYQWPWPCKSTIEIKIATWYNQTLASSQTRALILDLRLWAKCNIPYVGVCMYMIRSSFFYL